MSRTTYPEISYFQRVPSKYQSPSKIVAPPMIDNMQPILNCHFCKSPMLYVEYERGTCYSYCNASNSSFRCLGIRYFKYNNQFDIREISIDYKNILNFRTNINYQFKQETSLLYSFGDEVKVIKDVPQIDLDIIKSREKTLDLVAELLRLALTQ